MGPAARLGFFSWIGCDRHRVHLKPRPIAGAGWHHGRIPDRQDAWPRGSSRRLRHQPAVQRNPIGAIRSDDLKKMPGRVRLGDLDLLAHTAGALPDLHALGGIPPQAHRQPVLLAY